jgi:type VI secretion system protein ImpB
MQNHFFNLPSERIQVTYVPEQLGDDRKVELPFKLLLLGNYQGQVQNKSISDRKCVSIDKNNFDSVMLESNVKLEFEVKNCLSSNVEALNQATLPVQLNLNSLRDFHPDAISKQVPELDTLLKFRALLKKLKAQPKQADKIIAEINELLRFTL